ncbi:hypothetical protein ASG92_08580 [Arthrobacter sp. Soil736]|uniref:LysM peptidoglycan-binding domain-containing protein n=1 Tax=Arthrobacter sp. Soil736 TaxID=1736395 RepID=UPI0006FC3AB2|nr:LysM domain-containing protein [Arthrobacter sp. Soil736]KRE50340.1 hypothetical protein ASG92_08580 [Arthrobacter sp. Soil736]
MTEALHSTRPIRSDAALALVILGLGLFLAFTGGSLLEQWQRSASHRQSLGFEDLLGLVASAAGLAVVSWWVLSLVTAMAAALLERAGQTRAAEVTGGFSPVFMRRLALAALGMQLIGAPLAHADSAPGVPLSSNSRAAVSAAWAPTAGPAAASRTRPGAGPDVVGRPAPGAPDLQPQWKPRAPVTEPRLVAAVPVRSARNLPDTAGAEVAVRAGDSLWTIAARALGPAASDVEIAVQWPRWYDANRNVIGADPNVLLPGQVLKPPVL